MTDPRIEALREAVDASNQVIVAARIGYSAPVVSAVLAGKYGIDKPGNLERVLSAVEGALMAGEVECPIIGPIPRHRCAEYQRMPMTSTNPAFVELHVTCPTCTHSLIKKPEATK